MHSKRRIEALATRAMGPAAAKAREPATARRCAIRGLAVVASIASLGWATAPADQSCGLGPHDWCPSPPGDACGRHRDERSCRADPGCRGLPYRGESVVACTPDDKGFWSNCPAVGCIARSDPPGQPPRREAIAEICGSPRPGGQATEVHVWRTSAQAATLLELRVSYSGRPWSRFFDARGHFLYSLPTNPDDTPAGRSHTEVRGALLKGLGRAETLPCRAQP
jgi:hypothetical protein